MKILTPLVASTILVAALALAKTPGDTVTADVKTQTIQEIEKALTSSYAFPEVARKAVASLEDHVKSHDYDSISDGAQFADRLAKDINDVCHDAHLRVRYSPETLPVRKDRAAPSPDEIKADQLRTVYVNAGFTKVERMDGNIGYISFRNFMDPDQARRPVKAAMEFLANTDSLIIDIRQNGGGSPETVQLICSYFFGDKPVHLNDLVTRDGHHIEFWTTKKVDGPKYLNKDIYVLTSKRTGSAAEEFSYDLKCQKRATIIGEPTWGGANPGGMYRLNDHFAMFVPNAHAENPITHTNWEGTGVAPDVAVDPQDGLNVAYEMAIKKQIERTGDTALKNMLTQLLKEQEAKKGGH
jgi:C-terminal processing protease CtpA/Prc